MRLPLKEFAQSINSTPGIVERWIRQGRIPLRKEGDQCVFSRSALKRWAAANNLTFNLPEPERTQTPARRKVSLSAAVKNGGVLYGVEGLSVAEVLKAAVMRMDRFDTDEQQETLYKSLMAREELMSTGIGKGVAIPHPRTPLGFENIPSVITTCFLETPIDYHAVDHQPVFVMFILVAQTAKLHLHLLSRLSFCLRDEEFLGFLKQVPDADAFFERIADLDGRLGRP